MRDLIDFLNARFAQDEEIAHALEHLDPEGAARLLREVEAKRRILEEHPITDHVVGYGGSTGDFGCITCHDWDGVTRGEGYCITVLALAVPWSDHPEYREEWRLPSQRIGEA